MKKKIRQFNISKIIHDLPLNFKELTTDDITQSYKDSSRTAPFKYYNSKQSSCHKFNKPISKLS